MNPTLSAPHSNNSALPLSEKGKNGPLADDNAPAEATGMTLTFADGDRRLFDGAALKGYPLYKEVSSDYGLTCARVEGCSVIFEDKDGMFDELPPEFLYQKSVSLLDLKHAASVKLGLANAGRINPGTI